MWFKYTERKKKKDLYPHFHHGSIQNNKDINKLGDHQQMKE